MTDHGDTGPALPHAQPAQDMQGDTATPVPRPARDDSGDVGRSTSGPQQGLWQRLKAAWRGEI